MDKLRIPLSAFPERELSIDETVSEAELRPESSKEMSVSPVHVKGTLSRADDDFMFKGSVTGTYQHTCDRCLDEAEVPFEVDAVWVFTENPSEAVEPELSDDDGDLEGGDDSAYPLAIQNEEIDLRPLVWEEIVLNAPSKFLCQEECAGLCPRCGANRNREECRCSEDEGEAGPANSGLVRLGDLFPDLKKNQSEE